MEVIQSVKFKHEPNERVQRLLKEYLDMVNFCIGEAIKAKTTSLKKLHHLVYHGLKDVMTVIPSISSRLTARP